MTGQDASSAGSPGDQQDAASRTVEQRTQAPYQAEENQVQDEPFPVSNHEKPGSQQADAPQRRDADGDPGGAVHEMDEPADS